MAFFQWESDLLYLKIHRNMVKYLTLEDGL